MAAIITASSGDSLQVIRTPSKTDGSSTSVGLFIMKFLSGLFYFCAGLVFIVLGVLLIAESARRYAHFRKAIRKIREKETKLGCDIGMVR